MTRGDLLRGDLLRGAVVLVAAATLVTPVPAAHGLTPSALSITAPGSSDLGSVGPGQTIAAQLGAVTVGADAAIVGGWTATVSLSGQFTVTQPGQSWTFPSSRVRYWSGPATASSGLGLTVCVPGQATSLTAQTLTSTRTAYSCGALLSLSSSLTWRPTIVVSTQAGDPAGTYAGTITHSVS